MSFLLLTSCSSGGKRITGPPTSPISLPPSYNFDWTNPTCFRWNRLDDGSKAAAVRDYIARFQNRPVTPATRDSVVNVLDHSCTDGMHAPLSSYWRSVQVDIHLQQSSTSD